MKTDVKREFGRRLDQLRIRAALTLPELAAGAHLSEGYTRRLLSGLQMPRIDVVLQLATALGVEPGELLKAPEWLRLKERLRCAPAMVDRAVNLSGMES